MEHCIFCGIVSKEISSYILCEDEFTTAFLDINPVAMGHTLVIPNRHFGRLDAIDDKEVMQGIMKTLIKVSNLLITAEVCHDFTILSDNVFHAQQDIMHAHFHIIPRHHNEKIDLKLPTHEEFATAEELKSTYNLLRKQLCEG